MDKGREFWLFKDGKGLKDPDYQSLKPDASIAHEFIHTIEMSAYTKLKSERDAAVEALRFYADLASWRSTKRDTMVIQTMTIDISDKENFGTLDQNYNSCLEIIGGAKARAVLAMIEQGEK